MSQNNRSAGDLTNKINKRHIFADWTRQKVAAQYGLKTPTRLQGVNPTANPWSAFGSVIEGAQYTTTNEQTQYEIDTVPRRPSPPLNITATAGNGEAIITFDTPTSNGGSNIISYTVTSNPEGITASGSSSPIIITGLANGETYTFQVYATNAVGNSISSDSNSVTLTGGTLTTQTFTTVGISAWASPTLRTIVEYLIVAGGGGSGSGYNTGGGGGGGGGMVLTGTTKVEADSAYSVEVGDGGLGSISTGSPSDGPGAPGGTSQFGSIIALGGLGGYSSRQPSGLVDGAGGSAATTTVAANGGRGGGSNGGGGGGGGSSGAGSNKSGATGGAGGTGTTSALRAGTYGVGGTGANGASNNPGVVGASNTGNGARGGGAANASNINGAKGGSGIVVIRYYAQP